MLSIMLSTWVFALDPLLRLQPLRAKFWADSFSFWAHNRSVAPGGENRHKRGKGASNILSSFMV